jgi:SAM-dependent methyltransferase
VSEYGPTHALFYDRDSPGLEGDVDFYVEEAIQAGSPVLELGCGTGRVLVPVAEAGISVVGLDNSPAMLAVARDRVAHLDPDIRLRIEIVEGDMRDFALARPFRLAMIPYRAFLHLLTFDDQRRALSCIRRHLSERGRLVLNVFDPRLDLLAETVGAGGGRTRLRRELRHPDTGNLVVVWDTHRCDPERQLLHEYLIYEELDEQGRMVSRSYSRLTLRYIFRHEMRHLLELCGFRVEALYGDFARGPYRSGGEQVWVAQPA